MTYRITLVLAGGYSLSCLADEAIRDGCVEAHDAAGAGLIEWPFPDTTVTHQWPAGNLQIRWSDVVILAWEEVPHG